MLLSVIFCFLMLWLGLVICTALGIDNHRPSDAEQRLVGHLEPHLALQRLLAVAEILRVGRPFAKFAEWDEAAIVG